MQQVQEYLLWIEDICVKARAHNFLNPTYRLCLFYFKKTLYHPRDKVQLVRYKILNHTHTPKHFFPVTPYACTLQSAPAQYAHACLRLRTYSVKYISWLPPSRSSITFSLLRYRDSSWSLYLLHILLCFSKIFLVFMDVLWLFDNRFNIEILKTRRWVP